MSQYLMVLSHDPVTTAGDPLPMLLQKKTCLIGASWAAIVVVWLPPSIHILATLSAPAEKTERPSAFHATSMTGASCLIMPTGADVPFDWTSQQRTSESHDAETRKLFGASAVGEKASDCTVSDGGSFSGTSPLGLCGCAVFAAAKAMMEERRRKAEDGDENNKGIVSGSGLPAHEGRMIGKWTKTSSSNHIASYIILL